MRRETRLIDKVDERVVERTRGSGGCWKGKERFGGKGVCVLKGCELKRGAEEGELGEEY